MSVEVWPTVCCIFLALIGYWYHRTRRFHKLANKIPGPPALPVIGNLIDAIKIDFDAIRLLKFLHQFHGETGMVRFWTGFDLLVSVSDPNDIQTFYTNQALLDRSVQYKPLEQWFGEGNILTSSGEKWKKARRMMLQTFHTISPETMIAAILVETEHLFNKLDNYTANDYISFTPILRNHSDRITTRIALDEVLDEKGDIAQALGLSEELLKISVLRLISPLHYLDFSFSWTTEGRRFKILSSELTETTKNIVRRKNLELKDSIGKNIKPPNCYIYNLISKYEDDCHDELHVHLLSLFLTAGDTTSGATGFVLLMLGIHQDLQDKVYEEDCEIQKRTDGKNMKPLDLHDYKCLDKIIKESLRLYPVAPLVGRVAKEDVQFGKYTVPKGTNICAMPMWTNRRADLHDKPLEFNPDRFSPHLTEKWHPYTYLPFSSGPKTCAGNTFALMSMKITISSIIRRYKIYSEYKTIEEVDENLFWAFTLKDKNNIRLKIVKR